MADNRIISDRTEINRKVIALPRTSGDILSANDLLDNTIRFHLMPGKSIREHDAFSWDIGGYAILGAGNITFKLKFAGQVIQNFNVAAGGVNFFYGHGVICRETTPSPNTNLGVMGIIVINPPVGVIPIRGELVGVNFDVDNLFELSAQKTVAGDIAVSEQFLVYKHPRI